jgi:hypothetical protein
MKFTVTPQQIIKAIQTEPLANGKFADTSGYAINMTKAQKCKVCAVGAIVRSRLPSKLRRMTPSRFDNRITDTFWNAEIDADISISPRDDFLDDDLKHLTLKRVESHFKQHSKQGMKGLGNISWTFEALCLLKNDDGELLPMSEVRRTLIGFVKKYVKKPVSFEIDFDFDVDNDASRA